MVSKNAHFQKVFSSTVVLFSSWKAYVHVMVVVVVVLLLLLLLLLLLVAVVVVIVVAVTAAFITDLVDINVTSSTVVGN
jgi:hypothetical protein